MGRAQSPVQDMGEGVGIEIEVQLGRSVNSGRSGRGRNLPAVSGHAL